MTHWKNILLMMSFEKSTEERNIDSLKLYDEVNDDGVFLFKNNQSEKSKSDILFIVMNDHAIYLISSFLCFKKYILTFINQNVWKQYCKCLLNFYLEGK
jgi:hypothetical protein